MKQMFIPKAVASALIVTVIVMSSQGNARADEFGDYVGRSISGYAYGAVGNEMCGGPCAKVGRYVGQKVFTGAQRFSRGYADRAGQFGSYIRRNW